MFVVVLYITLQMKYETVCFLSYRTTMNTFASLEVHGFVVDNTKGNKGKVNAAVKKQKQTKKTKKNPINIHRPKSLSTKVHCVLTASSLPLANIKLKLKPSSFTNCLPF